MRRMGSNKNVVTATPRQLESIIRCSEALAKMRLRKFVERHDVEEALRLIKVATQQSAIDPITGQIDMDLISTGYTSGVRNKISVITEIIREIIKAQEEAYRKGGIRSKILRDDIKKKGEEQFESLSDNEFIEALKILEEEGFLSCFGNKTKGNFTIKLQETS